MNDDHSTSNAPEFQDTNVKTALNSRVRYFRSLGGTMILTCFDSAPIEENPYFIEIDEIEYKHLSKEMNS